MEDNDSFILHDQYHGCWCPGDFRSQDISSYGINLVCPASAPEGFWDGIAQHQAVDLYANCVGIFIKTPLLANPLLGYF